MNLNHIKIITFLLFCSFIWSRSIIWDKTFGAEQGDEAKHIEQTSDEGYVIIGNKGVTNGNTTNQELWLIKTDSNGDEEWNQLYGFGYGITINSDKVKSDIGISSLGDAGLIYAVSVNSQIN